MFIWILAIGLFGIFAGLGYLKGAVRTLVSTFGLILGLFLAKPMAPMVKPLLPSLGVKHPLWQELLPAAVVFLLIWFVAIGLSFLVHRKAYLYYKYKTDDLTRLRWERMNKNVGLCVGLFSGLVYFFIFSWIIYVAGYLTVQVSAEENNPPGIVKFLNKGREDLKSTGLDKTVAALDRTSPKLYEIADILGLIYQNPVLQSRLNKYPPFLTLGERPEFQEIANDKEFSELLLNRGSVSAIVDHPKFQGLIANQPLMDELKQVDLADLKHYLETGKSAKYDDEKILGRWLLDPDAVVMAVRKMKPDMTANEMILLKRISATLAGVSLMATVDGKASFKVDQAIASAAAAAANPNPTPPPAAAAPQNALPPGYANRYGRPPGAPAQGGVRPAAPKPAQPVAGGATPPVVTPTGEGTWKTEDGKYSVTFVDAKGGSHTFKGQVEDGELILANGDQKLIFYKAE